VVTYIQFFKYYISTILVNNLYSIYIIRMNTSLKKIKIAKKKITVSPKEIILVPYSKDKYTKAIVLQVVHPYVKVQYIDKKVTNELGNKPILVQLSNIKKIDTAIILNKNSNSIRPKEWISQESKRFPAWINEVFLPYRITEEPRAKKNGFEFSPLQKFIRDYLAMESPYRGVLLYHGLGAGKTCASVAVTENLKTTKNVVVISPASLRQNFIKGLVTDCGAPYKANHDKLLDKYSFVSYNASNTIDQLKKIPTLDDHVIVIDEVHNLVSMMVSKSKKGPEIFKMLMNAKNAKIVALSGTPIINFPFEIAKLCNILRGYIQVAKFYVKKIDQDYGKVWNLEFLKEKLMGLDYIDYIDIQQKYIMIYPKIKNYNENYDLFINSVLKKAEEFSVTLQYLETKNFMLFPDDEDEFRKYFIEETSDGEILKNHDLLRRRMLGLVSYYRGGKPIYYPTVKDTEIFNIPMSDYQFRDYEKVRDVEREREKGSSMKKALKALTNSKSKDSSKKKVSSLFRVFSREFSNFVFPEDIERPFIAKFLKSAELKKLKKKNEISMEELQLLEKENKMQEENTKTSRKDKELIQDALNKLLKNSSEYLTNNEDGLKKYSPKMAKMFEIVNKSPGLVFVYSAFRTLEGIEIFSRVLESNGYQKFNTSPNDPKKLKFAIWSGTESEEERENILKTFNSNSNLHGEKIKVLLATSAGAEGIDLHNVRQVHIMEPYWHEVRALQVIGRANRLNSHIELPKDERVVEVYRYHSVFSPDQTKIAKDKQTTDEYIFDIAMKKLVITNEIKQLMKEIAVDCTLNAIDNEKDIKCFSFGVDADGIAYKADIADDFVYGKSELGTKIISRKLIPFLMDDNKKVIRADKKKKKLCYYFDDECKLPLEKVPKNLEKIAVDIDTLEVFELESAKVNNPIKIGIIDKNGVVV